MESFSQGHSRYIRYLGDMVNWEQSINMVSIDKVFCIILQAYSCISVRIVRPIGKYLKLGHIPSGVCLFFTRTFVGTHVFLHSKNTNRLSCAA